VRAWCSAHGTAVPADQAADHLRRRRHRTVNDAQPTKVEPMAIKDIKVMETIKEGQTIYKR
jgi:hypothetical protein